MSMPDEDPDLYQPVSLNREYLAGKMLERYAGNHPESWNTLSMERRGQVREEYVDTLRHLEESLATVSPAFLIHHACREQSRFTAMNFPEEFTLSFFTVFRDVLSRELPQDYRKNADAFAEEAVSVIRTTAAGKGTCHEDAPSILSPVASSFLRYLLAGKPDRAETIIRKAFAAGTPVREMYNGIFVPVLRETGRLWQQGRATIAQEHFVTGEIRRIMDREHHRISEKGRAGHRKTVVAACAGEELHDIGIRMVADSFEMDGWNVYCTGGNTPAKSILEAVKERKPAVVALSITMPSRLPDVRYVIRLLRADTELAQVKIIVGGFPFAIIPDLWKRVGADAGAASAEEAVAAAGRLTDGTA